MTSRTPKATRFAARLGAMALAAAVLLLTGCASLLPRSQAMKGTGLSPKQEFELGRTYEADGEYDAALRWYGYAAANLPEEPDPQVAMGNVYMQQQRYPEAEAAYRRALAIDPDRAPALNNLAWLLHSTGGDAREAERLARRATSLAPDNPAYADTLHQILAAPSVP